MALSEIAVALAVCIAGYAGFLLALVVAGRRSEARALARLVPDLAVLFQRLLRDPRVPRRRKALLAAVLAYLAMPVDLVPDFIPVAGALDDAIVVALALRAVLRGAGRSVVAEHWSGPPETLRTILRLAGAGPAG